MFVFGFGEEFEEEQEISVEEAVEIFNEMTAPRFKPINYSLMEIEQKIPMLERLKNMDVWTLLEENPELTAEEARRFSSGLPFFSTSQGCPLPLRSSERAGAFLFFWRFSCSDFSLRLSINPMTNERHIIL